ncbi:hypothetical protein EON83_21110 [bacterium]|nr:MAG: hypothetical protein EON83_21110 [bacterium]
MIRYFAPLAVVFALASTAQAQNNRPAYQNSYTSRNGQVVVANPEPTNSKSNSRPGYSNSYIAPDGSVVLSRTTINTTDAGLNALSAIGAQTILSGGYPTYPAYGYPAYPPPGYGYPAYPPPGYGYPAPGYGYAPPAPYPYGYAPGAYFVPSQQSYLGTSPYSWAPPPVITTMPQVIVNNPYPPNYGYGSRTTTNNSGIGFNRGGISASFGSSSSSTNTTVRAW